MFAAAQAGCLECVKQCLEEKHISLCFTSLTADYTVLDYAQHGFAKGFAHTNAVVTHLEQLKWPPLEEMKKAHVQCIGLEAHAPSWRHWRRPQYWFFQAAQDGCLQCIQTGVEKGDLDPQVRSDTKGYTLMDYALYGGAAKTEAVQQYLLQINPLSPQEKKRPRYT